MKAQKAFTFMKGVEVFQNPRIAERWTGRSADTENALDPRAEADRGTLSKALPDPSHICFNDADGR